MTLLDLFCVALASSYLTDAWLMPGGLFEAKREWLIAWGASGNPPGRLRQFAGKLVQCEFCLPFWIALILFCGFYVPAIEIKWQTCTVAVSLTRIPTYALAAANLCRWGRNLHEKDQKNG